MSDKIGVPENSGVPAFLAAAGITRGHWMQQAKDQWRALRRPNYPLKVRVYAELILQSAGFQSEKAVKQVRNKDRDGTSIVPLTPTDIINDLHQVAVRYYRGAGIIDNLDALKEPRQNIRRALADLEEDGLVERRTVDGKLVRELSEAEAKKLSGSKIEYYAWFEPRKPSKESVRREYEDRMAEKREPKVVIECLPFAPQTIRDIRNAINLFHLPDSPFFRLSAETPAEDVQVISHGIETARVSFIDTVKQAKPEAFSNPVVENAVESSPVIRSENEPATSPVVRQGEVMPTDNLVTEPGADLSTLLRAGLVARKFHTLDTDSIRKLASELKETPLDWFWITLDDRLTRGRNFGFRILLQIATTARENCEVSRAEMDRKASSKQELSPDAQKVLKFLQQRMEGNNVA